MIAPPWTAATRIATEPSHPDRLRSSRHRCTDCKLHRKERSASCLRQRRRRPFGANPNQSRHLSHPTTMRAARCYRLRLLYPNRSPQKLFLISSSVRPNSVFDEVDFARTWHDERYLEGSRGSPRNFQKQRLISERHFSCCASFCYSSQIMHTYLDWNIRTHKRRIEDVMGKYESMFGKVRMGLRYRHLEHKQPDTHCVGLVRSLPSTKRSLTLRKASHVPLVATPALAVLHSATTASRGSGSQTRESRESERCGTWFGIWSF